MTDSEPPYTFLFPLWIAYRSLQDLLDQVLAPSGLSAEDFAVYSALARAGEARPSAVADFLRLPPTTVTAVMARLRQRGHVATTRDASDGRAKILRLTRDGAAAHQHALSLFEPLLNTLEAQIGSRTEALGSGLAALQRAIDRAAEKTIG